MIIIGDTPEQLGSVTAANALIIDGKVFTKEQVIALQAERDALAAQLIALGKIHSDLTNADMVIDDGEHSGYLITSEQLEDMEHYLSEPILCLAAHDAEVANNAISHVMSIIQPFFDKMYGNLRLEKNEELQYDEMIHNVKQYAAQLRAKAGA